MKYSIVFVEDEPTATEHFCDIVRLYCHDFEVLACGENGLEGLKLAKKYSPDLLITDIRMPQMDGLELIKRLREEAPDIETMVISSYQDFEYARTALRQGAIDYVLKPISPSNLKAALERAASSIAEKLYLSRINLMRKMARGESLDTKELKKHFPYQRYLALITRKNGLPSRFLHNNTMELYSSTADVIDMYGRDEMESLYICPEEERSPAQLVRLATENGTEEAGYMTTVLWDSAFPIEEIADVVKALYKTLDLRSVIGLSQVVMTSNMNVDAFQSNSFAFEQESRQLLEHYSRNRQTGQICKMLVKLLAEMETEQKPQLFVEGMLRSFLDQMRLALNDIEFSESLDFMIDDAFFYATCYQDLQESLLDILKKLLPEQNNDLSKVNTPEFIETIQDYVKNNLEKDLSLQILCKTFGISQSYLSRLFRKYTGQSFNSYLTLLRMEKAKLLLGEEEILVKDVASMVGYQDQFYFSRLFRSVMGSSPSEYAAKKV